MKILVDGFFFQLARSGIARVWTELLIEWARLSPDIDIYFMNRGEKDININGINILETPALPIQECFDTWSLKPSAEDRRQINELAHAIGADLFFSTYYTICDIIPNIALLHDMIPENNSNTINLDEPIWRMKKESIQQANSFVCVSYNTANELCRHYQVNGRRVIIAHNGITSSTEASTSQAFDEHMGWNDRIPYVVIPGLEPGVSYKNHHLVIKSLSRLLASRQLRLVFTGKDSAEKIKEYPHIANHDLVTAAYLSDRELDACYRDSLAIIYPSKEEGFGLPIIEALAHNSLPITCANSSLIEIGGAMASYVSSDDSTELLDLVSYLLHTKDSVTSVVSAEMQYIYTDKFNWNYMARRVDCLSRQIALEVEHSEFMNNQS